ncbi:MAG: nitrous oxide reductase family maturation protein NosD [Planctomycetota bacterium]|nr:nitrous oxide reductase family maturation protein NosD [Planctomycetota bacterium]
MRPRDALLLLALVTPAARAGDTWTVGPGDDLARALEAAQDGDTVVVEGGVHAPVVVTRRVALEGRGWPVIDGGGRGTVVKLAAAGASLRGFVVRGSGSSLDDENSGITVAAPGVRVEGNRVEEALFGVSLAHARGSVVADNVITGKALDVARRGDAIRVWYSDDVRLERNVVTRGRDVVLWYSAHLTVADNEVTDGRYGLHFMYTDDADIQRNRLVGNSVGVYLMYSRRLRMSHNAVVGNRGPSGFGLGLKDMDECDVTDNVFADNRVGAYVDNSPREAQSFLIFRRNLFAGNDTGVALLPSVRKNTYSENAFVDNGEHVGVLGGGTLGANAWSDGGRGNFWSDYAGYDANHDGIGDIPYAARSLYENLMDTHPELRLFQLGPASDALDLAAKAFPIFQPQPKMADPNPLINPPSLPAVRGIPQPPVAQNLAMSLGLLALSIIILLGAAGTAFGTLRPTARQPGAAASRTQSHDRPYRTAL